MNTTIKIKDRMSTANGSSLHGYPMTQVVEAFIDQRGIMRWTYALWNYNGNVWHYTTTRSPDEMVECIVEPYVEKTQPEKQEYYKDSEVQGIGIGWIIYIAAMIFAIVFREFYIVWGFGTLYFFAWRKSKLQKPVRHMHGYSVYKKVEEWDNEWKT
jgi:hypothetical protein